MIAPDPLPIVVLPVSVNAPKVAAAFVVVTVPPIDTALAAVAVIPPVKLSDLPLPPSDTLPVLRNVVGLVIVVTAPFRFTP